MQKETSIVINDVTYPVTIFYKMQKNIYFRFKVDHFEITSPYLQSEKHLLESLKKYAPNLIKRATKKNEIKKAYSLEEGYCYIFGEKSELPSGILDETNLLKYLKKALLEYVSKRTKECEIEMKISPSYKVSVRNTKSRYGSNSKATHKIMYSLQLVHYSKDIIDSVIYHELTHHYQRDHSKKFYNILLSYCPNYAILRKKLIHGEYDG